MRSRGAEQPVVALKLWKQNGAKGLCYGAEFGGQPGWEEPMNEAKPFVISKWEVWEAYKRVKANQGAAGVDEQSMRISKGT